MNLLLTGVPLITGQAPASTGAGMPAPAATLPADPALALPLFFDALRGAAAGEESALAEAAAGVDASDGAAWLAGAEGGASADALAEELEEGRAGGAGETAVPAFGVSALEPALNVVTATVLAALGVRAEPVAARSPAVSVTAGVSAVAAEVETVGGAAASGPGGVRIAGAAEAALAAGTRALAGEAALPPVGERGASVPGAATVHAGAALAAAPQGEAPRTAAEAAVLKLPNGEAAHWRQPLLQALGERLQVELGRGSERAVIRLDPPMMGSIEIVIRHEGGALQVQLSATHGEVLRQLQALGDSLRQELVHRQYAEVSVQVSDGSRDADGRQRQRQQDEAAPGRALAEAEGEQGRAAFALAPDQE